VIHQTFYCPKQIRAGEYAVGRKIGLERVKTGPLCPVFCAKLKEPCSFNIVPDGPYTQFPDILWVQKEGTQIYMSE
jgi:hypothetical protein